MRRPSSMARYSLLLVIALLCVYAAPIVPAFAQGQCSPVITIDTPLANATDTGQTTFTGWAVDQGAASGSGIGSVQIVVDGMLGSGGTVLGTATQMARPDVDAALGRTGSYGFTLSADLSGLSSGPHTFYVYAMTSCGSAYNSLMGNVQPGGLLNIDAPTTGMTVSNGQTVDIGGWTAGTQVGVYLDGPMGQGQSIGSSPVNKPRPDVAQATGRQTLANSGFDVLWQANGLSAGSHTLYVDALING